MSRNVKVLDLSEALGGAEKQSGLSVMPWAPAARAEDSIRTTVGAAVRFPGHGARRNPFFLLRLALLPAVGVRGPGLGFGPRHVQHAA
ncbi:hypothetical protein NDU88_003718 [Pleurodeles waltl]|uniref:Uncharacterized protein n=1 Tax=Pleurodeles waltl TaxID=8319 RepID=A0AAV7QCV8_PLEWA|nr:hypothetical protein NDU88_003718 [Pleurodeles waltl]